VVDVTTGEKKNSGDQLVKTIDEKEDYHGKRKTFYSIRRFDNHRRNFQFSESVVGRR
jgi:hypothetical protein